MGARSSRSLSGSGAARLSGKVYNMAQLEMLNEIERPTWVVMSGLHEDSHSIDGLYYTAQPIFQNEACIVQLGNFQSQEQIEQHINSQDPERRRGRLQLLRQILRGNSDKVQLTAEALQPWFTKAVADSRPLSLDFQGIMLQRTPDAAPDKCVLVQMEDMTLGNARIVAMQHGSPIHTFMFAQDGSLICANHKALAGVRKPVAGALNGSDSAPQACDEGAGGGSGSRLNQAPGVTLEALFQSGCYPKGAAEGQAAYMEAMQVIFARRAPCHRHTQPHRSKKHGGQMRWTLFEMWPIMDPVLSEPAVLVSLYNVTSQKQLELELQAYQKQLERQNRDLEQEKQRLEKDKAEIQVEKGLLLQENNKLAERLELVVNDRLLPESHIDADTPIDKTLNLLQKLILGEMPPIQATMDLFHMLTQNADLRQPVELKKQLMEDSDMEPDVGAAMVQLLQGDSAGQEDRPSLTDTPGSDLGSLEGVRARRNSSILSCGDQSLLSVEGASLDTFEDIPACIMTGPERMLQDAECNWRFDIFALAEQAPHNVLSLVTFHLLRRTGLIAEFNLNETKLCKFLRRVETGYMNCPYHNSVHVASVVQMTHMLMHHGGLVRCRIVNKVTLLASYIAAAVHDLEHRGLNNDYLIKVKDPLAITYNDQSPLENHHLAAAFRLMLRPQYRFIEELSREDQMTFRAVIIDEVLATDMKRHFNILSRFQSAFQRREPSSCAIALASRHPSGLLPEQIAVAERSSLGASMPLNRSRDHSGPVLGSYWDNVSAEDKSLARQVVLKCADIGHLVALPHIHRRWALQLEEEFFLQGDKERAAGMQVSPLMDRNNKGGITRSQLGFFSIVGIPLFKAVTDVFDATAPLMEGVTANYKAWEAAAAGPAVMSQAAKSPFASAP